VDRADVIASSPAFATRWADELAATSKLVDALGRPLDPGVADTVVAMRLAGFQTHQSCWGHWHRAVPGPWVHVVAGKGEAFESVDIRVRALLADFAASRRVAPHRLLDQYTVHHHETGLPFVVRIEGVATAEAHRGERPREKRELRAARRTMSALTDFMIRQLRADWRSRISDASAVASRHRTGLSGRPGKGSLGLADRRVGYLGCG
jgi:hypothetical protein